MSLLLPALLLMQAAPPPPEEMEAPVTPPGEAPARDWEQDAPPVDPEIIEGRERPGYTAPLPERIEQRGGDPLRALEQRRHTTADRNDDAAGDGPGHQPEQDSIRESRVNVSHAGC